MGNFEIDAFQWTLEKILEQRKKKQREPYNLKNIFEMKNTNLKDN